MTKDSIEKEIYSYLYSNNINWFKLEFHEGIRTYILTFPYYRYIFKKFKIIKYIKKYILPIVIQIEYRGLI